MKKKTLKTILNTDVSQCSDAVIEALKQLHRATFSSFDGVAFEVTEVDKDAAARRLIQSVRAEYEVQSEVQDDGQ